MVQQQSADLPSMQLGAIAAELRFLRDEREISRTLALYSRLLDAKDFEPLDRVFAEELTFNYGQGGEKQGLGALKAWMVRWLNSIGGTQHFLGQTAIDIEGERAKSRTYVQARHQRLGDLGGHVFDTNGEYVDEWERRPVGWRIVRRLALWAVIQGDPGVIGLERASLDEP